MAGPRGVEAAWSRRVARRARAAAPGGGVRRTARCSSQSGGPSTTGTWTQPSTAPVAGSTPTPRPARTNAIADGEVSRLDHDPARDPRPAQLLVEQRAVAEAEGGVDPVLVGEVRESQSPSARQAVTAGQKGAEGQAQEPVRPQPRVGRRAEEREVQPAAQQVVLEAAGPAGRDGEDQLDRGMLRPEPGEGRRQVDQVQGAERAEPDPAAQPGRLVAGQVARLLDGGDGRPGGGQHPFPDGR